MQLKDLLTEQLFCTVALPADDIRPFQILLQGEDGSLERQGVDDTVSVLFKPGEDAKPLTSGKDATVADMSGTVALTSELKASLGFMEKLKQFLGVSLDTSIDASSDDQIVFMFESPEKYALTSYQALSSYLNQATVEAGDFANKLEKNNVFIITEVLKSSNFAIGIVDNSHLNMALTLPSIKDFVEGKITYDRKNNVSRVIQYKGDKKLVFAVKAVQVFYDRSLWQKIIGEKGVFSTEKVKGIIVRDDEDIKVDVLIGQNLKF